MLSYNGSFRISTWTTNTVCISKLPAEVRELYEGVSSYVTGFLTAKHPFRRGAVCPFVTAALKRDMIHYSFIGSMDPAEVRTMTEESLQHYLELKAGSRDNFSAMVILLPRNFQTEWLLEVKEACKEACIAKFVMIGALYPANPAPSLNHPDYRPLRTPSPVLVLRDLTPADLLFLHPSRYNLRRKLSFLRAFIFRFKGRPSEAVREQVARAEELTKGFQRRLWLDWFLRFALVGAVSFGGWHAFFQ